MSKTTKTAKTVKATKTVSVNTVKFATPSGRGYSKTNDFAVKTIAGVTVPSTANFAPYAFRSALTRSVNAGVQTKHPGVVIRECRQRHDLSRAQFAAIASKQGESFGVSVNVGNLVQYERGICCPKIDKLVAISMALSKLDGMNEADLCGYSVFTREIKGLAESETRNSKKRRLVKKGA